MARLGDIFQERLYAIQWNLLEKGNQNRPKSVRPVLYVVEAAGPEWFD
jgi:hypothetical protein